MEQASELTQLSAAFLQDAEGAGIHRVPLGSIRVKLREQEIPVRLATCSAESPSQRSSTDWILRIEDAQAHEHEQAKNVKQNT